MAVKLNTMGAVAATFIFFVSAQAQGPRSEPTLEERIAQIERNVASLDTRIELRSTLDSGSAAATAARVEQLERSLERLTAELQRVERETNAALREAMLARREATAAQQLARDAANRQR
jgi:ubiquinone biosynthesis protein UbiJ